MAKSRIKLNLLRNDTSCSIDNTDSCSHYRLMQNSSNWKSEFSI